MLAELRTKSQLTLPKSIVTSLGLSEGDMLEITEKDGIIQITPVVVYPKKYIEKLEKEVKEIKENIAKGEQPVFSDIDSLMKDLEE
jgi:AbrB family looped-hinge helix DNA binding protein